MVILLFLLALAGIAGWMLRGAIGSRWKRNTRAHPSADPRYCWVEVNGEWHAFTDDALLTARTRAQKHGK